jgi:L-iditol 2-dehydrogenase
MQALVLKDLKDLELQEVPLPNLGDHDLLIAVKACGICGSDVHGYDGSSGRRIPPLIMGHEASGIVAEVGSGVTAFKPGDRVTFDSTMSCGACDYCRSGQVNLCDSREVFGVSCGTYRRNGAFAQYVAVPNHIVYPLPDSFSFEEAALIEAVSVAVHAAKLTGIKPGSSAVVIGTGTIGLLAIQAFRAFGCTNVFAVDVLPEKLEAARSFGADEVFLASDPLLFDKLNASTNGHGPDIAVEAVGAGPSIQTAINAVRRGGSVTLIGNLAPTVEIPLQIVVTRQLRLIGSCASAGEYPECIALMASGQINVKPLISAVAPLSEGPEWFDRLYNKEPGLMKVILQPGESS